MFVQSNDSYRGDEASSKQRLFQTSGKSGIDKDLKPDIFVKRIIIVR